MVRLTLHKTWLEAWITCPHKYYLMAVKQRPMVLTVEMQIGQRFHSIAQQFHEHLDYEEAYRCKTEREALLLFSHFVPEDLPEVLREIVANFLRMEAARLMSLKEQNLEAFFRPLATEEQFVCHDIVPEVDAEGTVDRIDCNPDKSATIVEYKTGYSWRIRDLRRELAFYVLLLTKSNFKLPITLMAGINPRLQKQFCVRVTDNILRVARRRILQIRHAHAIDFFPKRRGRRCMYCAYKEECVEQDYTYKAN